jgi:hypothetical protein
VAKRAAKAGLEVARYGKPVADEITGNEWDAVLQ